MLRKIAQAGLSGLTTMINGAPGDAPPSAPATTRRGPAVASAPALDGPEPGALAFTAN